MANLKDLVVHQDKYTGTTYQSHLQLLDIMVRPMLLDSTKVAGAVLVLSVDLKKLISIY